jgi:uroporphyrinogen III methyltransferase/synthase
VRVLITRPERQAQGMAEALRAVGAEPAFFAATRIAEAADGGAALAEAARSIATFDWVVLSSANGVDRLLGAMRAAGTAADAQGVRFAAIGPATAEALRAAGLEPALVADRFVAEGLLEALARFPLGGARVLLPQASGARPVLREGLGALGAEVVAVEAYRSEADGRGAREVREGLDRGEIGVVTFTSPSTVERFAELVGPEAGGAVVAVIGPVTAAAAKSVGLPPQVIAKQHTVAGLIEALSEHFRKPGRT